MNKNETCLNPNHEPRPSAARGLCASCYTSAKHLVYANKTTWEKLEQQKKAKPTVRRKSWGKAAQWFLEDAKEEKI